MTTSEEEVMHGGRPGGAAAEPIPGQRRFLLRELGVWIGLYGAYLAIRDLSIADGTTAVGNAHSIVELERATGLFHEAGLQSAAGSAVDLLAAYYLLGFAPLVAGVLVWLGITRPERYRELRTLLLLSLGIAAIGYVLFPTAPPRLVPGLEIADSVGLSSHDTGSVAGIRFNPYAAMPSMHVGWSLLVAIAGWRATRRRWLRALFATHPVVMAVTVSATGNHYFVDSIAGAAAALLAIALLAGLRRVRAARRPACACGRGIRPAISPIRAFRPGPTITTCSIRC